MYNRFFEALYDPSNGFAEECDGESAFIILSTTCNEKVAEAIGRLMLRALVDERFVSMKFPPHVMRLLVNGEYKVTRDDLEEVSSTFANSGPL